MVLGARVADSGARFVNSGARFAGPGARVLPGPQCERPVTRNTTSRPRATHPHLQLHPPRAATRALRGNATRPPEPATRTPGNATRVPEPATRAPGNATRVPELATRVGVLSYFGGGGFGRTGRPRVWPQVGKGRVRVRRASRCPTHRFPSRRPHRCRARSVNRRPHRCPNPYSSRDRELCRRRCLG